LNQERRSEAAWQTVYDREKGTHEGRLQSGARVQACMGDVSGRGAAVAAWDAGARVAAWQRRVHHGVLPREERLQLPKGAYGGVRGAEASLERGAWMSEPGMLRAGG